MTEQEKSSLRNAMILLDTVLEDMEDNWDETEPVSESDYNRWRELLYRVDKILRSYVRR